MLLVVKLYGACVNRVGIWGGGFKCAQWKTAFFSDNLLEPIYSE